MSNPLQVPTTEKTRHILLETDSRRLTSEIRDLPYADIPSALLMAHRRLHAFNRFSLPPAKRLELVRPFHYAFIRCTEHYRRQFEGSLFTREPNLHELDNLLEFLRELGFAFKHLIRDTMERSKRPAGLSLLLYMALNYLHHHALFSCSRGRLLKPSFWREVHYLYFTATDLELELEAVTTPDGKQSTIEQLYKQVILIGLSSPFGLSPEEQWRTFDYVARFGNAVEIKRETDTGALLESYSLNRECNQPALLPGETQHSTELPRLLNLAPFIDNLQRHMAAVKSGEALRVVGMERVQRRLVLDLLAKLHHNWTRNPERQSERKPIQEQIGLIWGLENICTMLDPVLRQRDSLLNRPTSADNRAWAEGENESENGIRLHLGDSDQQYPEAGQVVALIRQQSGQKQLQIGLVQWCALDHKDQPFCGIQRLHGSARKVTICPQDDQDRERNGLLVVAKTADGRARSLLVAPCGSLKPGGRVQVYTPQSAAPIHVEAFAVTHRTRQVETFEIRVLQ
ncbi:MAG TPA: hypothetical protein VM553_03575 [Dongiaceae bacterium]|nr:hypothetical protein [Dongiaceae bacterium]